MHENQFSINEFSRFYGLPTSAGKGVCCFDPRWSKGIRKLSKVCRVMLDKIITKKLVFPTNFSPV